MYLAPDFPPYLEGYSLHELEASAYTVVGLRPDFSVGFRNAAWDHFAAENGAEELADWNGVDNRAVRARQWQHWVMSPCSSRYRSGAGANAAAWDRRPQCDPTP
jgi:hypothetical protein